MSVPPYKETKQCLCGHILIKNWPSAPSTLFHSLTPPVLRTCALTECCCNQLTTNVIWFSLCGLTEGPGRFEKAQRKKNTQKRRGLSGTQDQTTASPVLLKQIVESIKYLRPNKRLRVRGQVSHLVSDTEQHCCTTSSNNVLFISHSAILWF